MEVSLMATRKTGRDASAGCLTIARVYLMWQITSAISLFFCSVTNILAAPLFSDDFRVDTTSEYVVTDTWTQGGNGEFLYDAAGERAQVLTGNDIGLKISRTLSPLKRGTFSVDFHPTKKYSNGGRVVLWLKQDNSNFYKIFNSDGQGPGGIKKVVNGQIVDLASFKAGYSQNMAYTITVSFSLRATTVEAFGQMLVIKSNTARLWVNSFEINLKQQDAYYDNIDYTDEPLVKISKPQNYHLQDRFRAGRDLSVRALAGGLRVGWGIRFILDADTSNPNVIEAVAAPYKAVFKGLTESEHTLDANVIDNGGMPVPGERVSDMKKQIGIGDYYVAVGDSITKGSRDDVFSDNTSKDGRNTGGGYEPTLNDLLTSAKGYPHTVAKEGVSGHMAADGLALVPTLLQRHPKARYNLIQYGTNDSGASGGLPVPSGEGLNPGDTRYDGSFKDNMQRIITAFVQAGQTPLLAKVPIVIRPCASCAPFPDPDAVPPNSLIQAYNRVIDELVIANDIQVTPPDFYTYFKSHPEQFSDDLHPNGAGYQAMANLWFEALTQ
jgi:lysophospholipase L1-like esterase